MQGYLSREYAESLAEFGLPRELRECGAWLLERKIGDNDGTDAMGLYPRFCCRDWSRLAADLDALASCNPPPVSVAIVTDPFAEVDESSLRECFTDRVIPFKHHFVVDLSQPAAEFVTSHHRYYTKVALRSVRIEVVEEPSTFLDDWDCLYGHLAERHHLTGIKRFSRAAFAQQLKVPGIVAFRAVDNSGTVGGHLWYIDGDRAYSHLAAFAPAGYAANASYALYAKALEYFPSQVRWLDLGAGAGLNTAAEDGLSRFKRGWSNAVRTSYFCGRVLDRQRYDELTRQRCPESTTYFPAYRSGELT